MMLKEDLRMPRWFGSCQRLRHVLTRPKLSLTIPREIWDLWLYLWPLPCVSNLSVLLIGIHLISTKGFFIVVANHPSLMDSYLQEMFVRMWRTVLPHPEELLGIISPVTLVILERATQPKLTWDKMEAFLTRLLKHELLFPIPFEDQIIILLQDDWNPVNNADI